ncbi:MAG: hypothetical protein ACRCWQ_09470 [Bacilli bacterium]
MFKKLLIASVVASTFMIAGCDDQPLSDSQLKMKNDKELLAMQLAHERAMKDKEVEIARLSARPEVVRESRQYDYQDEPVPVEQFREAPAREPRYVESHQETYTQPAPAQYQQEQVQQPTQQAQTDEGFGAGSMVMAGLAGAAAGYLAGEVLNNGMKSYKDDRGNVHYTDKDGRPVKKEAYESYKKANPRTTAIRENASTAKTAIANKATDAKQAVQTKTQGFRERARSNATQAKQTNTYQKAKAAPAKAVQRVSSSRSSGKRK